MENREKNPLIQFLIGLAMLVIGLYWFLSTVTVSTGFGAVSVGGFRVGTGLIVLPFIVGIVMLFLNFESFLSKLVTGLGLLLIIASVIMNTHFYFQSRTMYEYLIMLVFIFGGLALVIKSLFGTNSKKKDK